MNNKVQFCISLINQCNTLKTIHQIHAYAYKTGLITSVLITGKLILNCAVLIPNAINYARLLFDETPVKDVFMFNTLIRGFAESNSPQDSIFTYIGLRRQINLSLDSFSFAFTLKSVAYLRCLSSGLQLHCEAIKHGLNTHVFVGTTLVSMYAECLCLGYAFKVFDEMPDRNVVAWNAVLTACFRCDDVRLGERFFGIMPFRDMTSYNIVLAVYTKMGEIGRARKLFLEIPLKDDVSWSSMIVGCAQDGLFYEAFGYFRDLLRSGVRPNEVSLSGVLSACAQSGSFELGKVIHGYIEKSGSVWISSVNNALLDTYARCGNIGMARLVFNSIKEKTVVSWTSMIAGLAMQGYAEQAIQLFYEMESSGVSYDGITFIWILYACSHAGLIDEGHKYFTRMTKIYGIKPSIEHYGCMVDLYGRNGQLQRAYEFVCQMHMPPNAVIWRTLLGACMIHSNIELAEKVKKRLCELDSDNSGDSVLLSNIYAVNEKWTDVFSIRRSMMERRIKKDPGCSMIEVDKVMYNDSEQLEKLPEL